MELKMSQNDPPKNREVVLLYDENNLPLFSPTDTTSTITSANVQTYKENVTEVTLIDFPLPIKIICEFKDDSITVTISNGILTQSFVESSSTSDKLLVDNIEKIISTLFLN